MKLTYFTLRGWFHHPLNNPRAVLLAAALVLTSSCKKPADPHAEHQMHAGQASGSPEHVHPAQGEPQASVPSGASLYQFHDMFTDQNGKQMMLHQMEGKYVVVAMFYATCTAICPRIAAEMLRLEKSLSSAQRDKTRFVLISFDHERDNPAALQKFITKMRLTDSFTLLTGKPDAIREVAAALGVNYKKLDPSTGLSKRETDDGRRAGDYEYSHSSLFSLLSPKGEIILQHAGLSVNIDAFKAKIEK